MNKKNLKEKIVLTVVWLVLLAIVYFVIGIFLITDGIGFNSQKVYELLNDTLTLAAAFLAPVAAFVLFSDWRVQHKLIRNEQNSTKIIEILQSDLLDFFNLSPTKEEHARRFDEEQMRFNKHLASMLIYAHEIEVVDEQSLNFKKAIFDLEEDLTQYYMCVFNQFKIVISHDELKDFLDTNSCQRKDDLINQLHENTKKAESLYAKIQIKLQNTLFLRV